MSLPSFKLSRIGGVWHATGQLPSGRAFDVDCGKGSHDKAEGIAEMKLRAKVASSKGSRDRWARFHRERAAAKAAPPAPVEGKQSSPSPPELEPAAGSKVPKRDHAALRAKLLSLGDAQPIDPGNAGSTSSSSGGAAAADAPEVLPPGAPRDPDDPPLDDEGGELVAGLLAKGFTLGLVALANAPLKKRKPPQRGEPHEKGLEWFHDGLEVQFTKLIGKTATLGPTGKILAGGAIIVASIYMTAEPIDGAAAPAAAPPEPEPDAASTANGHQQQPQQEETALAPTGLSIGVFGKVRN